MALHHLLHGDRLEMLKWVSERNVHVPLSDLAYMLDIGGEEIAQDHNEEAYNVYDLHSD